MTIINSKKNKKSYKKEKAYTIMYCHTIIYDIIQYPAIQSKEEYFQL